MATIPERLIGVVQDAMEKSIGARLTIEELRAGAVAVAQALMLETAMIVRELLMGSGKAPKENG